MIAVPGYYDGVGIRPLDEIVARPFQRVIITVLDDFVPAPPRTPPQPAATAVKGSLARYANPSLRAREAEAWALSAAEKHAPA